MLYSISVNRSCVLNSPENLLLHHIERRVPRQFQIVKAGVCNRKILVWAVLRDHPHDLELHIMISTSTYRKWRLIAKHG